MIASAVATDRAASFPLQLLVLLNQEGGVKLDILPCNDQANKSADDTFEMVYIELFVVLITVPFLEAYLQTY